MIEFDEHEHKYTLAGARLPSVTQVLDQLGSYAGIPPDVLARKAEIGDAVHVATEMYDRGELDEASIPVEIMGYFQAWKRFRHETGFEPIGIEHRVYSQIWKFAGTLDRTGTFTHLSGVRRTALCVLDLKCTYKLMPAVGAQLAAYAHAWESINKPERIKHRFAVRLMPDGKYELKEHKDATDFSVFCAALTLHQWKQRHNQ